MSEINSNRSESDPQIAAQSSNRHREIRSDSGTGAGDDSGINSNNNIINRSISDPGERITVTTAAAVAVPRNDTTTTTTTTTETIEIVDNEPPHVITSLRATMERRLQERTQNWRSNFTNVFQEISPIVQHAATVNNNFRLWMPNRQTAMMSRTTNDPAQMMPTVQNPNYQIDSDRRASANRIGDSYVINLDGHGIQASGFAQINSTLRNSSQSINHLNTLSDGRNVYNSQHNNSQSTVDQHMNDRIHHQNQRHSNIQMNATTGRSSTMNNNNNHQYQHHHNNHNQNGNGANANNVNNANNNNNNNNNTDDGPIAEAFQQIPEARALFVSLLRYMPYLCIILAKTCYDHLDGILDFIALFITFSHANYIVRQEVGKQGQRSVMKLLREFLYIVVVIAVIGFMLETKSIYISLMFANTFSHPFTLRQLLFSVGVTDLILKLITVGIKIIIVLLPPRIIEYKRRGKIFLMTEAISQLYRGLAPIQPWLVFLLDAYSGSEKLLGVGFAAVYMVAKGSDLVQTGTFVKRATIELLKKVCFGSKPSKEQLQTTGGQCPICHDAFNVPVMLECTHIFCEVCVGTWFDREQTCPLCRAKVADDPSFRDGATTQFVQLY